ncbi:helix-turn-helix domain-containing protein [Flavonifractor plautii]|jgi:transcriptional regulator with XRE-family HTH domain|uniref:helix-turn-helix domain-containing protein n=1 Tax=Flavonifractor plautii TaxID=292800 RepID=UPI003D2F422A
MREWLRNARLGKGFTMKRLADELHISESYYCSIENGYRQKDMDISLVEKISKSLRVPVSQILKFEQSQRTTSEVR